MAANTERTFIAIKPDGVQRGLVGDIVKRFEQKGFRLVAMKFMHVSPPRAALAGSALARCRTKESVYKHRRILPLMCKNPFFHDPKCFASSRAGERKGWVMLRHWLFSMSLASFCLPCLSGHGATSRASLQPSAGDRKGPCLEGYPKPDPASTRLALATPS